MNFPEAGGSSSFARHAFNELVSFGAAWAQMLNYVITVAISAFFVPHYLSIFWAPLKTNPWDMIVGIVVVVVLVGINIVGIKEAAALNVGLAVVDFATQLAARRPRLRPDLQPARAQGERALGRRADVVEVRARDPGGDDRLHGDRDRLEPRRGGPRPAADDPRLDPARRDRRLRDLLHAAARRALGAAGLPGLGGRLRDASSACPRRRGLRERPGARDRREPRPPRRGALGGEDLRRRPRRDDPLHRHERRRDRRVADHLLDVDPPAAAGAVPAPAPEVQDAVALAARVRRVLLDPVHAARERRLHRPHVRVRGDALVHDRARRGDPDAAQAAADRGCPTGSGRT